METSSSLIVELFERTETYGKTSYELTKLKSLETTTNVATPLVARLSVIVVLALCVLILSLGLALLLGDLLGKSYYGFFIVAGGYLTIAFVFHFFLHKWIKKPLSDYIILQVLQ